ncbi:MAG TPA: methylmalonyl Co-A mutase-associated GTPase MeaB [Vicinamibacterales bacterium]|nr:methylmalonyl Co-A mutase-associated GTPase MeaB [Vicinamibacterales bacterium]
MPPDASLADGVLAGDARAIARAISLVESETPEAASLIGQIFKRTGRAYLIGVTGAPGTGKSTLVDALTAEIRRAGSTVGIIAVDPTSPFTGGAILGDRVRMTGHAADPGVYIRSMATRGHLGGLSRTTSDAALILDAAGKDFVVIETVGVGQDEVDIVRTADVSIVVLVPGTGDDVQAIKAGIMEIADIFVVNKADREGADRTAQAVAANLSLHPFAANEWKPPIVRTEANRGVGVDELWRQIGRFREHSAGQRAVRQRERHRVRLRELLSRRLVERIEAGLPEGEIDRIAERVAARDLDPYSAVAGMISSGLKA